MAKDSCNAYDHRGIYLRFHLLNLFVFEPWPDGRTRTAPPFPSRPVSPLPCCKSPGDMKKLDENASPGAGAINNLLGKSTTRALPVSAPYLTGRDP